jgi:hypothetical protein
MYAEGMAPYHAITLMYNVGSYLVFPKKIILNHQQTYSLCLPFAGSQLKLIAGTAAKQTFLVLQNYLLVTYYNFF